MVWGTFFPTFARLTEGGGSKAICAMPIEPTHFKRGFPKAFVESKKFQNCVKEKVINDFISKKRTPNGEGGDN